MTDLDDKVRQLEARLATAEAQISTLLLLAEQGQKYHRVQRQRMDAHETGASHPYVSSSRGPWRLGA